MAEEGADREGRLAIVRAREERRAPLYVKSRLDLASM